MDYADSKLGLEAHSLLCLRGVCRYNIRFIFTEGLIYRNFFAPPINAKNFSERPYYDGEKKYKFSTANYLRLISAENIYPDPRWYKICDVEKNNWTLKNNAKFEMLEIVE